MYTNHMLKLAGITVERVGTPAYGDESESTMNCMVQIVDEDKLKDMMTIDSLENISMCENNEALGLQVKLHNACAWKVTILADIPERGAAGPGTVASTESEAEEMVSQDPTRDLIRSEAARLGPNGSPNLTFGLGASEAFRSGPGGSAPKICTIAPQRIRPKNVHPRTSGQMRLPASARKSGVVSKPLPQNGLDGKLAAQIGFSRIESWGPSASAT